MIHPPAKKRFLTCMPLLWVLLASINPARAADCEALTDAVATPQDGLIVYRISQRRGTELLGLDGTRIPMTVGAPVPVVSGQRAAAPNHWANLVDVALYDDDKGVGIYRFKEQGGRLLVCRIDHPNEDVERFRYDNGGRLIGWQLFSRAKDGWKLKEQSCYGHDARGRFLAHTAATEFIDCEGLGPEDSQALYLHDEKGLLSRLIERRPANEFVVADRGETIIFVKRFGAGGKISRVITAYKDGDAIAYPAMEEDGRIYPDNSLCQCRNCLNTNEVPEKELLDALMKGGLDREYLTDLDWKIFLAKPLPEGHGPDCHGRRETVRVLASGTLDATGRMRTSAEQRKLIWSTVSEHPGLVLVETRLGRYTLVRKYSDAEWARCLDPKQPESAACPAH